MQLTTRRGVELQLERAAAALPAGTAASANDAASRELLGEVWIIPGDYRADKRNLLATCQRNKAKASMQKTPGNATTDQRKGYPGTKGGHAYTVKYE